MTFDLFECYVDMMYLRRFLKSTPKNRTKKTYKKKKRKKKQKEKKAKKKKEDP